ncbi:hypothetical protein HDA40_001857 [Hamadaea flava]|uniref:Leucine-rich repeat domain-containing protein n=1 Tax=Hamadaea flava TaxID=1742688 RepID=A0ABV8LUH5_9ACTN|nr:leucine-rich repeat domain-containing protein [Hamadaea flava]MCP2323350.1 hypothetical protein [Hamadaea flava]
MTEEPSRPAGSCTCLEMTSRRPQKPTRFHAERQDVRAPGWIRLLELIEQAAADGREVFTPLTDLTPEQRRQVITLPPTIAKLTAVRHLGLYGSNLVRIPPEIGAMSSLEMFDPYTSPRLHWFPYEITHCTQLTGSRVSTRRIYGNYKYRSHFPQLTDSASEFDLDDLDPGVWGAAAIRTCSVCGQAVTSANLRQVWISLWTSGADVLPLLVNACSQECVETLPEPTKGYVPQPHRGGPDIKQPAPGHHPLTE